MSKNRYNPVVPADNYSNNYASFKPQFNISRLKQIDVIDVLQKIYDRTYEVPLIQAGSSKIFLIENVVRAIEGNVIALANDKGLPFATGLLIHPQLVLTARHCLEERNLAYVAARVNYQKNTQGVLDYGSRFFMNSVVEEDEQLDYAIIRLNAPIPNFQRMNLAPGDNYTGASVFFHHPDGSPKKVSVHTSLESQNATLQYSAFHDSAQGSSGGVYCNTRARVFAMHRLYRDGKTGAQPLGKIYEKSAILQQLYDDKGNAITSPISLRVRRDGLNYLSRSTYSESYRQYLEVLEGKPSQFAGVNDDRRAGQEDLTYHHIIPKANLEFLWMLGKEFAVIEKLLKKLAWQDEATKNQALIVSNVVWAPWNLFIGPSSRPTGKSRGYDAHDGYRMEVRKPLSFDQGHWNKINELNKAIESCWIERNKISKLTKVQTIEWLDRVGDGASTLQPHQAGMQEEKGRRTQTPQVLTTYNPKMFPDYCQALTKLCDALRALGGIRKQPIHRTNDDDWKVMPTDKPVAGLGKIGYLLRGSENDGAPATGVMDGFVRGRQQVQPSASSTQYAQQVSSGRGGHAVQR